MGKAEALPFSDDSLDAVVSQFGLMFFGNRNAAVLEVLRVLKPGEHFAFAVWDSIGNNPAYAAEVSVVRSIAGDRAADPIEAPFHLGDLGQLRKIFRGVGARAVTVSTMEAIGRFPNVRAMVEADLRGWLPVVDVILSEDEISTLLAKCQRLLADYVRSDGTVVFPTSAHIAFAKVN